MATPQHKPQRRGRQRRKRCRFCRELFDLNPRVGSRQIACARVNCQKLRKQANQKRWLGEGSGYFARRYGKTKRWLQEHPGYFAEYRRRNPEKVGLDNEQRRIRRQRAQQTRADMQDSMALEPSVTKALGTHLPVLPNADIQDSIQPQVVISSLFSAHYLWRRYARLDRFTAPSAVSSSTPETVVLERRCPDADDPRRGSHEQSQSGEEAYRFTAPALPTESRL